MTILSEKRYAPLLHPSTHLLHSSWLLQEILSISVTPPPYPPPIPHPATLILLKLLSGHKTPLGKPSVASHCWLKSIFLGLQHSYPQSRKDFPHFSGLNTKKTQCTFPEHTCTFYSSPLLLSLILLSQMSHLPPTHLCIFFFILQCPISVTLTAYYFPWLMNPWGFIVL